MKILNIMLVAIVMMMLSACGGGGGGATPAAVADGYRGLEVATGDVAGVASVEGVGDDAVYTYNYQGTPVDVTLDGLEVGGFVHTREGAIGRYVGGTSYSYSRFGVVARYYSYDGSSIAPAAYIPDYVDGEVFYVGQKTSSMPTTGAATYNGMASSLYDGAFINAEVEFTVSYGDKIIVGNINDDPIFGERVDFVGTIEGSDFSGGLAVTYEGTPYDNAGTFSGSFFGPNAEELGGTGVLSDDEVGTIGFSFGAEKEGL